jgi:uncharacterized membrane protein
MSLSIAEWSLLCLVLLGIYAIVIAVLAGRRDRDALV